jgi:hypothetical protein
MKVPDKIFSQWMNLKSHGDGKKIAEQKGITDMDVSRAFKLQECSDTVFEAIAEFYKEKQELIKEYMPDPIETVNK